MLPVKEVTETTMLNLGALLDDRDDAAVTLVAGETRLLAHRAVLVARSPVFAAMFQHDTLEASSGQVTITDVEGPVLRVLLTFLYTLQVPQLTDMASDLLVVADKYDVPVLKAHCEQQLVAQLDVETAVAAGVLALRHGCTRLTQAAVSFTKEHMYQVMATKGWSDAVANDPQKFIEFSRLIAEPDAGTSSPAAGGSSPAAGSHCRLCGHVLTPGSAAPPTAAPLSPPPAGDAASRLRSLCAEEKDCRLIEAAEEGEVGDVEALLAAGADVDAKDFYRKTALHVAARKGHVNVVRCLLGADADVGARDSKQRTPLHYASITGQTRVVRLLLMAFADPNARDLDGMTPLHEAAVNDRTDTAAALLQAGANRGAKDDRGNTPLNLMYKNNYELKSLLS